jgi:hypothetical protein
MACDRIPKTKKTRPAFASRAGCFSQSMDDMGAPVALLQSRILPAALKANQTKS